MNHLRDAVGAVWRTKKLWILQLLVNPALFVAAALWLNIPESHLWQLVLTLIMLVVIVAGWAWLQAGTLRYFADLEEYEHLLGSAFSGALQAIIPFLLWAGVLAALMFGVGDLGAATPRTATYIRSMMPVGMRNHISESQLDWTFAVLTWVAFWIVIPAIMLPLGREIAGHAWQGIDYEGRHQWSLTIRNGWYWLWIVVLALPGVFLPQRLIAWLPHATSVTGETVSLVVRFAVAWLLAATAWTVLTSLLGTYGRRPRHVDGDSPGEPA